MSSNLKFQRTYELKMGVSPDANGTTEDAIITMPYSMEFTVSRDTIASSQTAFIRIYNLGEKTRALLFKDENAPAEKDDKAVVLQKMELKAGYGEYLPTIFKGYTRYCYSYREGTNFITEIASYDGGESMALGYVAACEPFNNRKDILTFLNQRLPGADKAPYISSILPGVLEKMAPGRYTVLVGNVWDLIQTHSDTKAFIDNGKLVVLADEDSLLGDIPQITSASGLLGSPKRGQNKIEFEMLFEPRLIAGQRINLKSTTNRGFDGDYRVSGFTHRGMISPSVNGDCRTSVLLWGPQKIKFVNGEPITENTN
jgi:hypothetical protein